mgnify:CR=1 FL=1
MKAAKLPDLSHTPVDKLNRKIMQLDAKLREATLTAEERDRLETLRSHYWRAL